MVDDLPATVSADDACPLCLASMAKPGDRGIVGTWDGALGSGAGNWYISRCPSCNGSLVGWEYSQPDGASGEVIERIRWEGRRAEPRAAPDRGGVPLPNQG